MTGWLWIPITVWAAFAQSLRNAAQRHLTAELGTIGATSVRFVYGLPFAFLWLLATHCATGSKWPHPDAHFWTPLIIAAAAQIGGTWLLLRVMVERNFALGVAYSKTEAIQVAVIALVLFGERLSSAANFAVVVATVGVVLISAANDAHPVRAMLKGWTTRSAWLGLAAGLGFAVSAVGFREATISLRDTHYLVAAAATLFAAQSLQSMAMLTWMRLRERDAVVNLARAWRGAAFAGFMGAAATAGWFTAMAIEPIAHVRTLGLIELLFSLIISRRVFRERLRAVEWCGIALLAVGLIVIALYR